ncbi:hypothetical protein L8R98_00220 [Vibrio splendidus]|uniref:VPA1262 family N-terminal domain-containing protein n=1 Tax=Vibrio splendidus TaxID=29497 RepID=UPI00246848CA|nr:VPA1262 family N-terminal domain-containing protein [Vibrio splendidus]MDH5975193.1 hypothetical protein [Vibrio splendidus]
MDDLDFLSDYTWAEVRLISIKRRADSIERLVFSTIKLFPKGRGKPSTNTSISEFPIGKGREVLFYRKIILTAKDAIEWYRTREIESKLPLPPYDVDIERYNKSEIVVGNLIDDPIWPNLGLPTGTALFYGSNRTHPAPFIGNSSARIHRRFGSRFGFSTILNSPNAISFISRRLQINLQEYPEYLGSIVLLALDPVIKSVENFLINSSTDDERIFYRFIPRVGQTLKGLKLHTFDEQSNLLTSFESINIPENGILTLSKGSCYGRYGYVITHPIHGILSYLPPSGFIRSIKVGMGKNIEAKDVRVPIGNTSKISEINSSRAEESVNSRIAEASIVRENKQRGKSADQRWFDKDSKQEAMHFIRSKIARASSRVIVVEPYIGVIKIPKLLSNIKPSNVFLSILTSSQAFHSKKIVENESHGIVKYDIEFLNSFAQNIEDIRIGKNVDIKVNVLSDELDDHFLIIDDDVWFTGNALTDLGERGSIILKLPNPDEILKKLEKLHQASMPLAKFHNKLKIGYKEE